MNIDKWISNYHGMELEPIAEENRRYNENGILFYSELLILKYIKGKLTHSDIAQFQIIVENITAYDKDANKIKGLYDRGAGESLSPKKDSIRLISHDNLTAISALSRLLEKEGLSYHKDIAKHGLKWQMRYDNAYPNKPRWTYLKQHNGKKGTSLQLHPRDWFYWLSNGGYRIAWVFFPIFFMANIVTCFTPYKETSGKWLMFVRLECGSKWSKLMMLNKKICYYILRKKYGKDWLNKIAKIYFWQRDDNPIRIETRDMEL